MMRRIISSMAACAIVALLTALNAVAAERPALPELLKALNVSGYPSVMHPPEFSGFTADGQKASLAGLRGRPPFYNYLGSGNGRGALPVAGHGHFALFLISKLWHVYGTATCIWPLPAAHGSA